MRGEGRNQESSIRFPRGNVGGQLFLSWWMLSHQHQRLLYGLVLAQRRFNFAQLNAKPAQLHLSIQTTQELDGAVRQVPRQISAFIQAARAEGVRDELGGGQGGTVVVSARQAVSTNTEFAWNTDGHGLQLPIQDVDLGVAQRSANGHRHRLVRNVLDLVPGREGRVLGGAIDVQEASWRTVSQHFLHSPYLYRLAAKEQMGHRTKSLWFLLGDLVEQGGGQKQGGDPLGLDRLVQGPRRQGDLPRQPGQAGAVEESPP